jgi:ribonuclease PH
MMTTTRNDGRAVTDLREIKITRNWLDHAEARLAFFVWLRFHQEFRAG